MFYDDIIQRFILQSHPSLLVSLKDRTKEVTDLFSYEKYIEVLENPCTIELLCCKWDIQLPCPSFHFFLVRWNLKHLLDEDVPLWYFEKYALQFLLAPTPVNQIQEIHTKREDFYNILVEKRLIESLPFIKKLSPLEIFENELFSHPDANEYLRCFDTMKQNICKFGFPKNLIRINVYKKECPKYFDDEYICMREDMLIGAIENVHGAEMLKYLNPTDEELEELDLFIYDRVDYFHMDTIMYLAERFNWHTEDQNMYIYLVALGYDVTFDKEFELSDYNVKSYSFLRVTKREAFDKLIGDYIPENLKKHPSTWPLLNVKKAAFDLPY